MSTTLAVASELMRSYVRLTTNLFCSGHRGAVSGERGVTFEVHHGSGERREFCFDASDGGGERDVQSDPRGPRRWRTKREECRDQQQFASKREASIAGGPLSDGEDQVWVRAPIGWLVL